MTNHRQQPIPREKKPQESLWTDLNDLYISCVAMTQAPAGINHILRATDLHPFILNMGEFTSLARTLVSDVERFNNELQALGSKHLRRSGNTDNPNQLMAAISIHEEYLAWIDSYNNTVIPTIRQLTDIGEAAMKAKETADKATAVKVSS